MLLMARIRTIKPEFFTSEDIVGLSPLARLLYIALWCEADKEGRLEWKPNTFKLRYLPGDGCDIVTLCNELLQGGLVRLYGDGCAVIPRFRQHQHLNPRESESRLPDPDACNPESDAVPTRAPRVDDASPRVPHASARVDDASARVPHAQGGREGKGREGITTPDGVVGVEPPTPPPRRGPALPLCPVDQVIGVYHEVLPELPRVRLLDDRRKRSVGVMWRWILTSKKPDGQPRAGCADDALAWLRSYFERVRDSDFLMGRGQPAAGHENWRCDFDFLLTDRGKKHVIEKTGVSA